jgi:hypothetical protein
VYRLREHRPGHRARRRTGTSMTRWVGRPVPRKAGGARRPRERPGIRDGRRADRRRRARAHARGHPRRARLRFGNDALALSRNAITTSIGHRLAPSTNG